MSGVGVSAQYDAPPSGSDSHRQRTAATGSSHRRIGKPPRAAWGASAGGRSAGARPVAQNRRVVFARVVAEALLGQHLMCPGSAARDRERGARYPIGRRPVSSSIVSAAGLHVGSELLPRLREHRQVCVAVAGDFVPALDDALDELRVRAPPSRG